MAHFKTKLNQIREAINLRIYDSKEQMLRFLRYIGVGVSVMSIFVLLYYHGFYLTESQAFTVKLILKGSLGFYLLKYFVQIFYSFSPWQLIKATKWEALLMFFLTINILTRVFFGEELLILMAQYFGIADLEDLFIGFVQIYVLLFVTLEIGKASQFMLLYKVSPPVMLIFSFVILIVSGTILLMLPAMTTSPDPIPVLTALFTSTSASCITGLIVEDTATYFTAKGHAVIMVLFQLGGLNIVSFASWFGLFAGGKLGIKQQAVLYQSFDGDRYESGPGLFRQVFRLMIATELVGAIFIFFLWDENIVFDSFREKVFASVFHSISAFNNAGFSTFTDGLYNPALRNNYGIHLIIMLVIVFGSLGFGTLRDVFNFQTYRDKFVRPWKHLRMSTKVSLYMTGILIPLGAALFLLLEWHNVFPQMDFVESLTAAFFQSIAMRTAGFNTIDLGQLSTATLLVMMVFMFIGGSTGSTAGGIKTSTFVLVVLSALTTIRGRRNPELFRMTIPNELMNKAFSIFLFAITFIALGTVLLSLTAPSIPLERLLFEQISAFCTVGVSTGITAELGEGARMVLISSMFIGRVGSLTLFFALSKQAKSSDYKYPKATMMVG